MTNLLFHMAAAIDAARKRREAETARQMDLCQLAVCRGKVRTVWIADSDGDVQPYGYCMSCGLPVG